MDNNFRDQLLAFLTQNWGEYVSRIKGLNGEELDYFLKKQGYVRLLDLLAHITAWWQMGMQKISTFLQNPDYEPPSVNVDEFNAAAVEGAKDRSEDAVIESFETTRLLLVELIQDLSDQDLQNQKIARQLEMEIIGHYNEHHIG